MASLLIRNVDVALHAQLRARARAHHRSLEEEVRETLRAALARDAGPTGGESLSQLAARFFGREQGIELDLPSRGADPQRASPNFTGPEFDR